MDIQLCDGCLKPIVNGFARGQRFGVGQSVNLPSIYRDPDSGRSEPVVVPFSLCGPCFLDAAGVLEDFFRKSEERRTREGAALFERAAPAPDATVNIGKAT